MGKNYHFPVTKNPELADFNYFTLIALKSWIQALDGISKHFVNVSACKLV